MTRRDYERIAAALGTAQAADHRAIGSFPDKWAAVQRSQRRAVSHLARALAADNPRFNRQRFEQAATATADLAVAQDLIKS